MAKRAYDKVSKNQVRKIHSKDKDEPVVSLPKFSFGKKKEKTDPRKVRLKKIDSDQVAWHIALLSPSPGEPEQLVILQRQKDGSYKQVHYDEDGSDVGVQTDEDEVENIYMKSKPLTLVDIHTHPEWVPPSFNDVALFVEFDSIAESYLVTPKTTDQGINIVYSLHKRKNYETPEDRDVFRKEWEKAGKEAEEEIKRKDKANLDWFADGNVQKSVDRNKEFALKLKRVEILGRKYKYDVRAFEKDIFLLSEDIDHKKAKGEKS